MAEAVVARPLVRVAEHLEGLGRLFEQDDRLFVARILVRMILDGQLAIGVGDLLVRGGPLDAQDFVVVTFAGHCHHGMNKSIGVARQTH